MSYAEELGHSVIGFTDHEFVGNWIKIEQAAKEHPNLKVIRGNEIYLCRNGLTGQNFNREYDKYYHFILLAKDSIGAHQIMEISTRAWERSYMARGMRRVPTYYQDLWDIIATNPGHVMGSTACLGGALPTQILKAQKDSRIWDKLEIWLDQMEEIFGKEDFYLEMQPSNNKEQIIVNKQLMEYVRRRGNKIIITTDSHYLKKADRKIHKAYLNAQNGDREVDDFYATTYMMGTEELESFFPYLKREELDLAYGYIKEIENKCEDFSIQKPLEIPSLPWKDLSHLTEIDWLVWTSKIPMLGTFRNSIHEADRRLSYAVIDGIQNHPDLQNKKAYDEINACLEDTWKSSEVNNARWSAYFLNLQGIVDNCWKAGTLVGPSRGSGGGFILLYVLDITQINPLKERTRCFRWRFLNPERQSPLDKIKKIFNSILYNIFTENLLRYRTK